MRTLHAHFEFKKIFLANIQARSRTSKGVSDTSVSKSKKPLLKSGDELKAQVLENTENLISRVWSKSRLCEITPESVRKETNSWYDIIQKNLQPNDVGRYRTWPVKYSPLSPSPEIIEHALNEYYEVLSWMLTGIRRNSGELISGTQNGILAWIDRQMDAVIHPWADGCGRMATASVMWASVLHPRFRLPRFRDRDEHYRCIEKFSTHKEYFSRCLSV